MLQINISLRRLLMKYIPQLDERTLKDIEGCIALKRQYQEEVRTLKLSRTDAIEKIDLKLEKLGGHFLPQVKRLITLYSAQRRFAMEQGQLQQVPASLSSLARFIAAFVNLLWVEITTFPAVWLGYSGPSLILMYILATAVLITALVMWPMVPGNSPPQITSAPDTLAKVFDPYTYQVTADDPDGDSLYFYLLQATDTLSLNIASGQFSGAPAYTGTFAVKIKVEDTKGAADYQSFMLHVVP